MRLIGLLHDDGTWNTLLSPAETSVENWDHECKGVDACMHAGELSVLH